MTIENLIKVAPPPAAPVNAFDGPWEPIEMQLGTPLPPDYKDFVRLYGEGQFLEFFGIHSPIFEGAWGRLVPQVHWMRRHPVTDAYGERPAPMWPQRGGLLVCGISDYGDRFFWLTRGRLEEWPIVMWDRGFGTLETFECDLTDFLAGVISGEIWPKEFPEYEPLLEGQAAFTPSHYDQPLT